jgi:hypothetical protein
MQFVHDCVDLLRNGTSHEQILELLRANYRTPQALRTKTCLVRMLYDGPMEEDARARADAMRQACANEEQTAAAEAWIATMGRRRWRRTGNKALDELARGSLLPPRVDRVRITMDEVMQCKQAGRERAVRQSTQACRVNGSEVVRYVRAQLATPWKLGFFELALCLLVASGRRTAELLNGRSSFAPSTRGDHWCLFDGQLKTRTATPPYDIPLCVPFAIFDNALAALRASQEGSLDVDDAAPPGQATNDAVSRKYQSGLARHLHKHPVFGCVTPVHRLRALYVWLIYRLFEWDDGWWVSQVASRALGHTHVAESASYLPMRVTWDDAQEGSPFVPPKREPRAPTESTEPTEPTEPVGGTTARPRATR